MSDYLTILELTHNLGQCQNEIERLNAGIKELEAENDELKAKLNHIETWCNAYPLKVFPEPDMEAAADALRVYGMTLDSISASNMRHVLNGVRKIIDSPELPVKPQEPQALTGDPR